MGEGFAAYTRRKQPLTPGFAVPSHLGEGCYQVRTRCKCQMSKLQGTAESRALEFLRFVIEEFS
jgi:hypothetical protein